MSSKSKFEQDWDAEFEQELDPQLEKEMLEYAKRRYEDSPSLKASQNQEELARQLELSTESSKQYRWVKQDELAMHPSRMGRVMPAGDFLNILRNKCKLSCWYADVPNSQGFLALVIDPNNGQRPSVVCGVQPGVMPEYSVMNFDRLNTPTNERYRGWRTVLLRLIGMGFIREDTATRAFGEATGPASRRYREILYGYRNQI